MVSESGENEDAVGPHQLANELTRDAAVQAADARPNTRRPATTPTGEMVPRVELRVGRLIGVVVLGAIAIGLMISALLLRQMTLLAIGAVFIIPFLLLVSAPVWLASAIKQAQDETVHEQREARD